MKKLVLTSLAVLTLANASAYANVSSRVETKRLNDNELSLTLTLNNQANAEIHSDSELIPAHAKVLPAQEAVIFDIQVPAETGIKRIRYFNGDYGCDFYIDVQEGNMMPGSSMAFITGMPINAASSCNVFNIGGVNHLAVSFTKIA